MKILVIEDDSEIRETLKNLLEMHDLEVLAADSGAAGVRLAASNPDFIFCDVAMPGMDGFAVLEAIRARQEGRLVPFVFLTAKSDRSDLRHGMALGADDYITKPFTEKDIMDAIAARSQRHRPLQERVEELSAQHRRQTGAEWSHELLTPLNGMLGGLQLLEMEIDTISREDLKEVVQLIRSGVDRQEILSRKLVRYFELEQIKVAACRPAGFRCKTEAALPAGLKIAVARHQRQANVEFRCEAGAVALPQTFLADTVGELADNALRFSPNGEKVIITGTASGPHYQIEVLDAGPGMTAEEKAQVAPFRQFGRASREQQGLGLGLAGARMVAQLGGGTLLLDDGPEGRGLRVTLRLPLC